MTKRGRASGRPKRSPSGSALRREILVYVEGLVTEEDYLVHWHRAHRDRVFVAIGEFRGSPLQLVQHAVAAKKHAEREERRRRGRAYDEVWCVFDTDVHPNLEQASALAVANGIGLAVSNPCVELWFILHFESQTAFIERGAAQAKSKTLVGCEKALTQEALKALAERHDDAKERAQALDEKHDGDGSPAGSNPSSSVWRLVDSIRSA